MKGHTDKKNRVPLWLLGLVVALVLLFLSALPVSAHGEDGTLVLENVPVWMTVLIYGQLTMAPLVGFWLIKQAIRAWLRA